MTKPTRRTLREREIDNVSTKKKKTRIDDSKRRKSIKKNDSYGGERSTELVIPTTRNHEAKH